MTDRPHWSEGLNEAQRRAAAHDEGPLAVLAGPGTGKTRVITHRIARLIHEERAEPESIGAMTFTVKAADEMQTRLGAMVGGTKAGRVRAGTFHSLGRRILSRFGDMIGLGQSHEIMDSVQRMRLLTEAVGEAAAQGEIHATHLALGGREGVAHRALAWIDHLRTLAIFPNDAHELVHRWQTLIDEGGPKNEETEPWDDEHLEAQRAELDSFRVAATVYERFTTRALDRSLLSFDDFILLPIRVLREVPMARAIMHDELRHLVVDEFQDVNGAQLAFLKELAPPARSPDLCVVGDDDQAIYGFRGSDDRAFQHFTEIWQDVKTIALTQNYRSAEPILEAANQIITKAHDRFEPEKAVHANRDFEGESVPDRVEAVHVGADREHGVTIASMILADRSRHPDRPLSSYAVIASSHKTASEIGRALSLEGIAVDDSAIREDREHPAVTDVKAWIEALVRGGGSALTRILVRPPASMPATEAIALQDAYDTDVRHAMVEGQSPPDPAAWIVERAGGKPLLAPIAELFGTLRELSTRTTALEMITEIVRRTGAAHRELPSAGDEAITIAALVRFLRFAQDLQPRLDPPGDLAAFWRYYDALTPEEQIKGVGRAEDIDQPEPGAGGSEGVRLLTAHASKGLEFDTVFLPRIGAKSGHFGHVRTRDEPVLPEALSSFAADARSPREREQDEVRRLFYVACTRAERRLVLLSERARSRSNSMHLFQELAWRGKAPVGPDDRDAPVKLIESADVMRETADCGVRVLGADALLAEGSPREARSRVITSARTAARRAAARALDSAEFEPVDEEGLDCAADDMAEAARQLAIIRRLEMDDTNAGDIPAWLLGDGEFANSFAERLDAAREDRAIITETGTRAPLELSFSKVRAYRDCPGCYYLRYVLGLKEEASAPQIVGVVAHRALERFYGRWRDADATGQTKPSRDDLVEIAHEIFLAESRRVGGVDPSSFEQIRAQLETGYDALHDDHAEVMMLEENAKFFYRCSPDDEHAHVMKSTIDRVDRTPTGGFRIIDYKTGQPWSTLAKPRADDLQLGIYAIALAERLEIEPESLEGTAEYWLFSTGERGVVSLSELRLDKVRKLIDGVITGILQGEFTPKKGCTGPCQTFLNTASSEAAPHPA